MLDVHLPILLHLPDNQRKVAMISHVSFFDFSTLGIIVNNTSIPMWLIIVTCALFSAAYIAFDECQLRRKRLGYVFLSWTLRNPRDCAAMQVIKSALDRYRINYFDYTKNQIDDSTDKSDEISAKLVDEIRRCDCSIEIISAEILGHDWVQHERRLMRNANKYRYFACLDSVYLKMTSDDESRISRLDFSDGRTGVLDVAKEWETNFSSMRDATFFATPEFDAICDGFVRNLKRKILQGKHLTSAS